MNTYLTKTILMAARQCPKRAHMLVHRLQDMPNQPLSIAGMHGQVIQSRARELISGGLLVDRYADQSNPLALTQGLINSQSVDVLYEAGFFAKDVEVYTDILVRDGDLYDLYEVKAVTTINDDHIFDAAIQAYISSQAGLPLGRVQIVHVNPSATCGDLQDALLFEDVSEAVQGMFPAVATFIAKVSGLVQGPEPLVSCASHCNHPSPCEFAKVCIAEGPALPVSILPNSFHLVKRAHAIGIDDISDLPHQMVKSDTHKRLIRISKSGQDEVLPEVKVILDAIPYPRHFVDFETAQFPYPRFPGVSAYDQIPFQLSCHTMQEDGNVFHKGFLDLGGSDPRLKFAQSLIEACGSSGPVIVYNASFERRILSELAATFPLMRDEMESITDRLLDLLPIVKQHYYHPAMRGSWSLKEVVSALVPEMDYAKLEGVRNGTDAQVAYLRAINPETTEANREILRAQLDRYCYTDTLVMIEIIDRLSQKASTSVKAA